MEDRKHVLWPLRKGPDDFEAAEQERLARLFGHVPELKAADELWQDLTMIFDTASAHEEGRTQLQAWDRLLKVV